MSAVREFASIELIPGELEVRIFHHRIAAGSRELPCWTYLTKGMAGQQQKEIVLTILQTADTEERPSQQPLEFFTSIYVLASQGQWVDVADASEFSAENALLGRRAVLYLPAQKISGIEIPEPALAAILLPAEELEVARRFGPMRVVNRLAEAFGFYPFPPWSDLKRSPLPFETTIETSALSTVPVIGQARARILGGGDGLVLRIDPRATISLRDRIRPLSDADAFAIWTGPDSSTEKTFVWNPDSGLGCSELPTPYDDSEMIEGCFVAIVPGQPDSRWRRFEDGFEVWLTQADWNALRPALMSGRPHTLELVDGSSLRLDWCREEHATLRTPIQLASIDDRVRSLGGTIESSIDGAEIRSTESWNQYLPESAGEETAVPAAPVELQHIMLLTSESEIAQRLSIKDLGDFTRAAVQIIEELFHSLAAEQPQELVVEICIQPGGTVGVRLKSHPGLSKALLDHLRLELLGMQGPAVQGGPVAFEAHFLIWANSLTTH